MSALKLREQVAWLAHAAHEAGALTEGQIARALGLDRVEARDVMIAGREISERLRAESIARAKAYRPTPADPVVPSDDVVALSSLRANHGAVDTILARVFADGAPRSAPAAAQAMGCTVDAATARMIRSGVVERVPGVRGQWRLRGER